VLPPEEAKAEAAKYFERWFAAGSEFLETGKYAIEQGWSNRAAFLLHQATEQFYHCTLLVLTLYSPKSHKLNFLRSHAEDAAPELIDAWPRSDKASRRAFELLRQAYVNARYSPQYSISQEQLIWLGERIALLQELVREVSERRLG
jgi:HEPN domain-containing protein